MLVRDPAKRAGLDFLADDAWINEGCPDSPIERDVSSAPVGEDEEIIQAMLRKFPPMERETLLHSLRQNLYDDISAIYYLMYYQKQAKGGEMSPDSATGPMMLQSASPGIAATPEVDLPPLPGKDKEMSIGADMAAAAKTGKGGKKPSSPSPSFASLPEGPAPVTPQPSASTPVIQHSSPSQPSARVGAPNLMARIDEDAVLVEEPEQEGSQAPVLQAAPVPTRPNVVAIPVDSRSSRRRRFTVGGEAEVAKLAAEDEDRVHIGANGPEAADLLRRLQTLQREQQMQAQAQSAEEDRGRLRGTKEMPSHPVSMTKMPIPTPIATIMRKMDTQTSAQPISPTEAEKAAAAAAAAAAKPKSTISGFFRSHLRRQSDNPASTIASSQTGYNESTYYTATMIADVNALSISSNAGTNAGSYASMDPNDDKPRSLRFTFNSSTTSSKVPEDIVREVMLACDRTGMSYRPLGKYLLECTAIAAEPGMEDEGGAVGSDRVKFEVEICKLPRLKNLVRWRKTCFLRSLT